MTRSRFLLLLVGSLVLSFAPSASATDAIITGSATRIKTVFVVTKSLYTITSSIATAPSAKSPQAMIDADVNKTLDWLTIYDGLPSGKVQDALKDGFHKNGFNDEGRIKQFTGAFSADLAANSRVTIHYDATAKATTVTTPSGSATIAGADFMKGVWSIWFGNIDQPGFGNQLVAKLPG
jgi:hypothetical protein